MSNPLIERSEILPADSREPDTRAPLTVEVSVVQKGDSYALTVFAWEPGQGGRSANLFRSARSLRELAAMSMSPEAGLLLREAWPVVERAFASSEAIEAPSLPLRPEDAERPRPSGRPNDP